MLRLCPGIVPPQTLYIEPIKQSGHGNPDSSAMQLTDNSTSLSLSGPMFTSFGFQVTQGTLLVCQRGFLVGYIL